MLTVLNFQCFFTIGLLPSYSYVPVNWCTLLCKSVKYPATEAQINGKPTPASARLNFSVDINIFNIEHVFANPTCIPVLESKIVKGSMYCQGTKRVVILKCKPHLIGGLQLLLCTYWLSGRAGRENIWLEVMAVRNERSEVRTEWPRAKYFPVRPDLTQSISILSYDKIRIFCFKQRPSRYVWAGRTAFYCPLTKTRTAPITWLFCVVFIREARAGKYGHMINVLISLVHVF